jgi:hypothetical protein
MTEAEWRKCESWISRSKRWALQSSLIRHDLDIGNLAQLQDAVTTAHETSDAFSDETLREQAVFQYAKEAEIKEMLGNLATGQIEFYKAVSIIIYERAGASLMLSGSGNGRI